MTLKTPIIISSARSLVIRPITLFPSRCPTYSGLQMPILAQPPIPCAFRIWSAGSRAAGLPQESQVPGEVYSTGECSRAAVLSPSRQMACQLRSTLGDQLIDKVINGAQTGVSPPILLAGKVTLQLVQRAQAPCSIVDHFIKSVA